MSPGNPASNQTGDRIVISYRRDDSAVAAGQLVVSLNQYFGDQVFLDVDNIDPGTEWRAEITTAIERASAVIVVIGPQWLGSAADTRIMRTDDVVRYEVGLALSRGKPVFPVLIGNTRMPTGVQLPPDLAALSAREAIGLTLTDATWDRGVGRLIDGLARVGIVRSYSKAFPDVPAGGKVERRGTWLSTSPRDYVCVQLSGALQAHGMQGSGWRGGETNLTGGSRTKARLLGGFLVNKKVLPTIGWVRVTDGPRSRVEVLLRDDFGGGSFSGMENIYGAWFEACLADFQRASQGS